jgi:calcium permeable stress-gated cation channel
LAHADAVFAESKTPSKPEGVRPTMRTGFLGLVGSKVDTIDHCNEKIKELLPKLEAEQKISLQDKQQHAALVFFNSRAAATAAAQTIHAQMIDTWIVSEAPEPRAVIWPNLSMRLYMRQVRQVIVCAVVFLTVVFYMIPISFISALTTLANLERLAPFLKKVVEQPELRTVLEAYLPQLVLIIFLALLPAFLMFLSKSEGIPSESHAARAAAGKYFYFIVFNVFIGVTITGTLWSSLKSIINHPSEIVNLLAKSLPGNATFFLTFVALK